MANIQSTPQVQVVIDKLKLQTGVDKLPNNSADYIQPVISADKNYADWCRILESFNSATVSTPAPTDRDLYITSLTLSVIKDATATSTSTVVSVVPAYNDIQYLAGIAGLTLTAQSETQTQTFPTPIRLQRGSNIILANSAAVGNIRAILTIQGYTL